MHSFFQLLKRDFLNLCCNMMWIVYSIVFPFLLVVILGFLNSGNYGSTVTSYDYYGVTMMVYMVFNTSTTAANSFMEERIKRGNMRIIYSPMAKPLMYTSKILAAFLFSSACYFIAVLLLTFALGVNFGGWNVGFVAAILLMSNLFSSALGVMLCCMFKTEETTNQILSIIINIFSVFGGVFFQIDGLGKAIEKMSYASPVKWIVTVVLKIIYDNNFSYFLPTMLMLASLCAVTLLLCGKFYRMEDYI